ncbi:MAG: dispase autolysis-inducing protein [Myxococcota bacterium]
MRRIPLMLFLVLGACTGTDPDDSGVDAGVEDTDESGLGTWKVPTCESIVGTGAVTFSTDGGATLVPTAEPLTTTAYTTGLVAFPDVPGRLLAVSHDALLRSDDAGCTWADVDTLPILSRLVRGAAGTAWAWAPNTGAIARVDADGTVTTLPSPTSAVLGFGAAADGTVALGGGDGAVWTSTDGGLTWSVRGTVPVPSGSAMGYTMAFDPADLDHAVFGLASEGAFTTFDGGATWAPATGLGATGANVFTATISPVDPDVVWAQGIDYAQNGDPVSQGRRIWRSEDGGHSFTTAVEQSETTILLNGPLLVADAADADVVWFVYGTWYGNYGTDLFRYDHTDGLTRTHNPYDTVGALTFSPADPKVLYLGLSEERTE